MIQLQPQETFPIVYTISDPNDSAVYYVRAVVRNSASGAVINISNLPYVNLTKDVTNSRRFSKNITAPSDSSGQGFYIDVTTNVYTDSGYTTLSDKYEEVNQTYLVQQRWNQAFGGGGGGIVYKTENENKLNIQDIVKEVVKALDERPTEKPDLSEITYALSDLKDAISEIEIPKPEKVDLESAITRIGGLISKEIKAIKFPEIPKPDYTPIMQAIESIPVPEHLEPKVDKIIKDISSLQSELVAKIPNQFIGLNGESISGYMPPKKPESVPFNMDRINRMKS